VLQAVLDKGTSRYQLTYNDRALQFLRTFVVARDKENYFEIPPANTWEFVPDIEWQNDLEGIDQSLQDCRFAFQPIIDPFARRVTSFEALIRTPNGGSPDEYFSAFGGEAIYHADIKSKRLAFRVANKLGIGEHRLSINLLPMSLVTVPNAVEVTENEIISRSDEFAAEVRKLKAAGISLALDDFGAGFAGLSLLSKFQPDKIKIDRELIRDVHKSGPKQAIMHAIIKCCASLEIAVIAEGVEQAEEWMWLEAAGISQFQGFLFAYPLLNGFPAVAWPEIK
jgi:EAL domain-containing protein (putative c-di-GMP-specific phosphodiesterase class I)